MTFTNFPTPISSTCTVLLGSANGLAVQASCTGTPPTDANIFEHGCLMYKTDGSAASSGVYQNTGTSASPVWTLVDTALPGDTASSLIDTNGVTALDVGTTASAVNNLRVTNSATGAVSANAVTLSAVGSDSAVSISMVPKGATGLTNIGLSTGTGKITVGSSSAAQTVAIGDGAGVSTVNIASNGADGNAVSIADGAHNATVTIGNSHGTTAVNYLAGSGKHIFTGVINATSPVFVTPDIGAATGTSLAATAGITSSGPTGAGIGYATGAGGAVTQITNRSTGVTLDKLAGQITTDTTSLAAEAAAEFTVTNSTVAIGDVVVVSQQSGANGGNTNVYVSGVANGSFKITVANNNPAAGTAETGAIIINYAVIKSVAA